MKIRPTVPQEKSWIEKFLLAHWGADFIVSRGKKHFPSEHEGLIAEGHLEPFGLLTFRQNGDEIEILTFDAIVLQKGVGSRLLEDLKTLASDRGVRRIWLITSNDNLDALRFYQRRGFDLCAIHKNAIDLSRKLKPVIPFKGSFDIPIRHEIELEIQL